MKMLTLLALPLVLFSCGLSDDSDSRVNMFGSLELDPQDPGLKSSVAIKADDPRMDVCSGVLVSNNLVVTAAHCVVGQNIDLRDIRRVKSYIHFSSNSSMTPKSHIRPIVEIKTHPDYDTRKSYFLNDIAWIKFSGGVPSDYQPSPVLKDLRRISDGATFLYTGHGMREDYNANILLKSYGYYLANHPNITELPGIITSRLKTEGFGPCSGDSGGPVYTKVGNRWYVTGVLSATYGGGCGMGEALHNALPYFYQWVERSSGVSLGF